MRKRISISDKYLIYARIDGCWRIDNDLYSLQEAIRIVKGLRRNGVKAFYHHIDKE